MIVIIKTDTFAENCRKLLKMTQIGKKIVKTHVKGTTNGENNGCKGLLRAAGEKSVKKVATVATVQF
jgi:hypothetical protein